MNEFWVCTQCHSLVKANVRRCYSCKSPRPEDAQEVDNGVDGAVVTPGIDNGLQDVAFLLSEGKRVIPTGVLASLTILAVTVNLLAMLVGIGIRAYAGVLLAKDPLALLGETGLIGLAFWTGIVSTVSFLVGLVLWLVFEGVSLYNAPLLGAGNSKHSIPGALAWWFVPILNIWIPIRIVADLHARLGSKGAEGQLMVGLWWALHVFARFFGPFLTLVLSVSAVGLVAAGAAGASVSFNPSLAGASIATTLLDVIQSGLEIVSGAAFIVVIRDLHERQAFRADWLAEGRERFEATQAAANGGGGFGPGAPEGAPAAG